MDRSHSPRPVLLALLCAALGGCSHIAVYPQIKHDVGHHRYVMIRVQGTMK